MRFFVLSVTTMILFFASARAQAQSSLEGFSTGRYEIRKSTTVKKQARKVASETDDEDDEDEAKPAPTPVVAPAPEKTASQHVDDPSLSDQAKSLWQGKGQDVRNFYLSEAHPDDVRNNRVEVDIMPTFVYNDSQSDFAARRYSSAFNALDVGAKLWMTPGLGLSAKGLLSLGADMSANDGTSSRVSANYTDLDFGLHFRKYFGLSRKARSVEVSLLYTDDKTDVPTDSAGRARLNTSGFGLGLKTRLPSSINYAWVLGLEFYPWLNHSEQSDAGVSSGSEHGSNKLAFDLGGEFKFNRQSQIVWNATVSTEKDSFTGTASANDPSGNAISNVGVTNTLYMMSLGYRWGN